MEIFGFRKCSLHGFILYSHLEANTPSASISCLVFRPNTQLKMSSSDFLAFGKTYQNARDRDGL